MCGANVKKPGDKGSELYQSALALLLPHITAAFVRAYVREARGEADSILEIWGHTLQESEIG